MFVLICSVIGSLTAMLCAELDSWVPLYAFWGLWLVWLTVKLVVSVRYSKKEFTCFHCGESFTVKWYKLYWFCLNETWSFRIRTNDTVDYKGTVCRRYWIRCPHCRHPDSGVKITQPDTVHTKVSGQ